MALTLLRMLDRHGLQLSGHGNSVLLPNNGGRMRMTTLRPLIEQKLAQFDGGTSVSITDKGRQYLRELDLAALAGAAR